MAATVGEVELRSLRYLVAVADEGHVGRAAERLHMSQPPLSRAIRQLEDELGLPLFERTPRGVTLTAAGTALVGEARMVLGLLERLPSRVAAAAGTPSLAVGTLADAAEQLGAGLVAAFRAAHPAVAITMYESDLADPSAGLRAGLVEVAITRTPFDTSGLAVHALRAEPVGAVLPIDDPLAGRESVTMPELADRAWVRLPDQTDARWRNYWTQPGSPAATIRPPMRTIQECVQSVLWNGTVALAPLGQWLPDGLVAVRVLDRPLSRLVVAWRRDRTGPLVRSFVRLAAEAYRESSG